MNDDTMVCPNCEATMNIGDACPQCNHDEGDPHGCDCRHCDDLRSEPKDEWDQ